MRMSLFAPLLFALVGLAACAQPGASGDTPAVEDTALSDKAPPVVAAPTPTVPAAAPQTPVETGIPGRTKPAPPMSQPLPPEIAETRSSRSKIGASCSSNSDCVVKNVGSCCGAMPACVHKNTKVDPQAVQAECTRTGMSSVCGFKDIQSCSCVSGTCQDAGGSAAVSDR